MIKDANCIIIGGPIAVGKSSLVESLPFMGVQELYYEDELQSILLKKLYEGDKVAAELLQFDMMLSRFEKYKSLANKNKLHVFDRSIFEDSIFAKFFLKNKASKNYYQAIWKDKINELIKNIGKPKLYIYLDCSWLTFKKRLFKRSRSIETNYFKENELYFKKLLRAYKQHMLLMFKKYKLNYLLINTNNKSIQKVQEIVSDELNIQGICDEIS